MKEANQTFIDKRGIKNRIIEITKEEIKQYFGDYKNIKELREKAIKFFSEHLQGKIFDIGNFKDIRINLTSRKKYKSFSADERKLLIVPKLLIILETSKYRHSSDLNKNRKDNIKKFHYFINETLVNGKEYDVYITIAEDNKGNLFYNLDEKKTRSVSNITNAGTSGLLKL